MLFDSLLEPVAGQPSPGNTGSYVGGERCRCHMVHPGALWTSFPQLLVSLICAMTEMPGWLCLPSRRYLASSAYLAPAGEPAARSAIEKCMVYFFWWP